MTDDIARLRVLMEVYRKKQEAMDGTPFAAAYAEAARQIEEKIASLDREKDTEQNT